MNYGTLYGKYSREVSKFIRMARATGYQHNRDHSAHVGGSDYQYDYSPAHPDLERTQMIGILKSIGARDQSIRYVFIWFALYITVGESSSGNVFGLAWPGWRTAIILSN
jgi:hypothetical protein